MYLLAYVAHVFLFMKYKLALFVARISLESVRPKNQMLKRRRESSCIRWENSKHVRCSLWFNVFVLMSFVVLHTITSCNSPAPYFPAPKPCFFLKKDVPIAGTASSWQQTKGFHQNQICYTSYMPSKHRFPHIKTPSCYTSSYNISVEISSLPMYPKL